MTSFDDNTKKGATMNHSDLNDGTVPFFDDDAICERAVGSGLDAACVRTVLTAQFWYLVLIGAIDVHGADDRLRRARDRGFFAEMIVSIGDVPTCDYDDEHVYVVATTGLDERTVSAVLALVRAHEFEIGIIDRNALDDFRRWAASRREVRIASC